MQDQGEKGIPMPGFKLHGEAFLLLTDVFVKPSPPGLLNIPIKIRASGPLG